MNANEKLNIQAWRDETALDRFQIIAPLIDPSLDQAKYLAMRKQAAIDNDISERTLRRYIKSYRESGFEGLKPKAREYYKKDTLPENYEEIVQEAILLRREVPSRSIEKIILILELEHRVEPGVLKRSTLQKHMQDAGFSATQMKIYADANQSSSKRYCKPNRMMLIQGDIKYGPVLPIGENGAMVQTYLSSAMDDHSRFILHSQFYDNQEAAIVEDTFHKAILKHGAFDKCYFDNGKQYVAKQLKLSLARLSIHIRYAPVDSGKSKGKIEKYHQVVDGYIAEAKAKKIRTLDDLNRYWKIYLEQYYHNDAHDGIRKYYEGRNLPVPKEGITPLQEWNRDARPLRYLDTAVVNEAFLYHESRKVDKGGCISFKGRLYETKTELIGFTVEIAYDPNAPETVMVHYPGIEPFPAVPLKMEGQCAVSQKLPDTMLPVEPETSRFLDALEKKYEETRQRRADAISFGSFKKEV